MDNTFAVWTKSTDPAWLARNAGCVDVLIATGLPRAKADRVAAQIRFLYGDFDVQVTPSDESPEPTILKG